MVEICHKNHCCGCGACYNICPQKAITMKADKLGFLYPMIDEQLCVNCRLCKKVCPIINEFPDNSQAKCFAAASKNESFLQKSSSGGVFPEIAEYVYESKGVVYGAVYRRNENDELYVCHVRSDTVNDIKYFQNSKYLQSDTKKVYQEVEEDLKLNKLVLFTGTPCQIAAVKSYLRKEYSNLITVETVCHGVPSAQLFQDYVSFTERKIDGKITEIRFRDKTHGWGKVPNIIYVDKKNKSREMIRQFYDSSYFLLFLRGDSLRESCYNCHFANKSRNADITLGDYWGIESVHPEIFKSNGGSIKYNRGVSCIIVNTKIGEALIEKISGRLKIYDSEFDKIYPYNLQLVQKFPISKNRDRVINTYLNSGYAEVDRLAMVLYRRGAKRSYEKTHITTIIKLTPILNKMYYKLKSIKDSFGKGAKNA